MNHKNWRFEIDDLVGNKKLLTGIDDAPKIYATMIKQFMFTVLIDSPNSEKSTYGQYFFSQMDITYNYVSITFPKFIFQSCIDVLQKELHKSVVWQGNIRYFEFCPYY